MDAWEGRVELAIGREGVGGGVLNENVLRGWEGGEQRVEVLKRWEELVMLVSGGKGEVEV